MVKRRNMKSCLSEQSKKSDCFQRNSFSTGVRTGNDEQRKVIAQPDVDRNYFFRIQKRVAAFFDVDTSAGIELGLGSVVGAGKLRTGKNKIKFCKQEHIIV